jgi:tetratricopeptide (TPR) repeat protein
VDPTDEPVPGKPRRSPVAVWFLDRLMTRELPEAAGLLLQRARARARVMHWARAAEDYERAARAAPHDAAVLLEVGRAFAQHKEADRAADYLARAAAAAPQDADFWLETARELVRLERWDQAADHFLHAIDLQPDEKDRVAGARAMTCRELARSPQAFDLAVRLRPKDRHLWAGRAQADVERGQWKEAADDFARAVALSDIDERSYEHAAVLLVLGDEEGYRKAASDMVDRLGDTRDPFLAYVLARTCSLVPKSVADPARAVAWARQAVADQADRGWYLHALGLALYRTGDFEAAVARLTQSEKTEWVPVLNWLVLAMAHHRLGHAAEADRYLGRATDFLDSRPPTKPFTAEMLSPDAEEAQILRREAEELIRGKGKSR